MAIYLFAKSIACDRESANRLEMQECLAAENLPWVSASTAEQKEFLVRHLLNWVPAFRAEVQKCAGTQFFKALAKIPSGYLRMEKAIVEDPIEKWDMKPE